MTSGLLRGRGALLPGEESDLLRGRGALLPGEEGDLLREEDETRRASRVRTTDSIRQRLNDMNEQFTAIQHMSDNMEHDFKNTKLTSKTLNW